MAKQDYQKLFDTRHLNTDLKKRSLRGGAVTLTTQAMSFVIQLGSTMVLARILTPDDYGMMAMVVAITGLAGILINLGLSTATIQRAEINHAQVSTLFWINAGIGAALMLLVSGLSPVIAWFYKTPELKWVAMALSCNFLINGMAVQHQALLNRQMRFVAIAVIQIGSMLAGISVAIMMALKGFGYWALVSNSITISVCTVMGAWLASGWRPGLPRRDAGVGSMVKFGSDIVGFNIINYFARNLDNILIGRYHGSSALGLYSKAYQLLMMPITNLRDPMNKVALPALSRLQDDPTQYRNYYIKFLSLLSFLSMPLVVCLFVLSDNIISFFLGSQWMGASVIFKVLALAAFIQPVSGTRGLVLLSCGKSRRYLKLGILGATIVILSFIVGVRWGALGVATAYSVQTYLFLLPFMYLGFYKTPVTLKDFFIGLHKPFIASFLMGGCCYFLSIKLSGISDFFLITTILFCAVFLYCLFFILIPGGREEFRNYYYYGKEMFCK